MAIKIDPQTTEATEFEGAIFKVRPLTGRQVLAMSTRVSEKDSDPEVIYEVVIQTLDSWEGVVDGEGSPIECNEKNIEFLPLKAAIHVFEFAASLSGLTGEEAGN